MDDDQTAQLVALDPTTGAVAWQRSSSLGRHIPGVEEHLVVDGDTVFHLESGAGATESRVAFTRDAATAQASGTEVVAVNAFDGEVVWRQSIDGEPSTPLVDCDDALCVTGESTDGHLTITRMRFADGSVTSAGDEAFEPLMGLNGSNVMSASRESSAVALTADYGQRVVWTRTRTELFGTDSVSPDDGWGGEQIDGVWVIWLGGTHQPTPSLGVLSGVSEAGDRLWSVADTTFCPIFIAGSGGERLLPIRCGRLDPTQQTFTMGVTARLDPHTGQPVWSLDLGTIDAGDPGDAIVRFDDGSYAVNLPGGAVTLDVERGPGGPPATRVGWCITMDDHVEVDGRGSIVAASWAPCTLGKGPNATPPGTVPAFAGPTLAGFGAWVEDGQVRAVRVR